MPMKTPLFKLNFLIVAIFLWGQFGCIPAGSVRSGSVEIGSPSGNVLVAFGDHDRNLIHSYYYDKNKKKKHKNKKMPPGLAKKGKLPPGLQKQLRRNGQLPPGLSRNYLPENLERQLSRLPSQYMRIKVGGDIVLMNRDTNVILDILYDLD